MRPLIIFSTVFVLTYCYRKAKREYRNARQAASVAKCLDAIRHPENLPHAAAEDLIVHAKSWDEPL